MNKCKKYLSLIYKDIDGIITKKEKHILDTHIKACKRCEEEYRLMNTVKIEFKKDTLATLPENFKPELRKKLVEYNSSRPSYIPLYKKSSFNILATACLALGITIFALNQSSDINLKDYNDSGLETNYTQKATEEESLVEIAPRITNEPVKEEKNTKRTLPSNDIKAEIEETTDAGNEGLMTLDVFEEEYLIIDIEDEIEISELIPFAVFDNGFYYCDFEKLEEVKELLKDYTFIIENEDTENKEKFIIK